MIDARRNLRSLYLGALIFLGIVIICLSLQSCQSNQPTTPGNEDQNLTPTSLTPIVTSTLEIQPFTPTSVSPTADDGGNLHSEEINFPPPSVDPVTPIPPPLQGLSLSDEVRVWVLLGSDTEPPFIGRTKAIHLLFVHPRFSKASLVSLPGDLYVYIPGYTMQRLNTAYAFGGIEALSLTLSYNFGITPDRFVLAHPGDFQWLVDDVNSVEVTVFYPMPQACGGVRAGQVQMDGALALCYASYRDGMDEVDRMQRQQQLLRAIFRKLTQDGNLIKLPILYASYENWIETNFSLTELMGYIPLALRLGDPDRIGYYMVGWDQMSLWEIPGYSQAQVFLPDQDSIKTLFQQAIDDVMKPAPLTNQVQTLEAQLTVAFEQTVTSLIVSTPTPSPTPILITETPTLTPPGYP